jgi:hypothetical protein
MLRQIDRARNEVENTPQKFDTSNLGTGHVPLEIPAFSMPSRTAQRSNDLRSFDRMRSPDLVVTKATVHDELPERMRRFLVEDPNNEIL